MMKTLKTCAIALALTLPATGAFAEKLSKELYTGDKTAAWNCTEQGGIVDLERNRCVITRRGGVLRGAGAGAGGLAGLFGGGGAAAAAGGAAAAAGAVGGLGALGGLAGLAAAAGIAAAATAGDNDDTGATTPGT